LMYAGHLFKQEPLMRHVLVLQSDMRQSAAPVNIENPRVVVRSTLQAVRKASLIADLADVDVFVIGAHSNHKDAVYWQSLQAWWTEYFKAAGAHLRKFAMSHDRPDLSTFDGRKKP
jgi:hypothetical protein